MSLLSRCRARSSMLRCLSGHSHKCCAAWPNSSARGLADADGHLRLTTDPTFSTEQGLHDLSRIGVWASAALATAILWAQKPEAPVKCTAFDDSIAHGQSAEPEMLIRDIAMTCTTKGAWSGVSSATRDAESTGPAIVEFMASCVAVQPGLRLWVP